MTIWWVVGILIYSVVCSYMCYSMAGIKKYKKTIYFAVVGFVLGALGVIYVAGLPLNISIKEEIVNCLTDILSEEDVPSEHTLKMLLADEITLSTDGEKRNILL